MKLGFLVSHLGPSQEAYQLITAANAATKKDPLLDITLFYDNLTRPVIWPQCATMMTADAYTYTGPLIATTLASAFKLLNFPSTTLKYFYVWDFEWLRIKNRDFAQLKNIYSNTSLQILSRSNHHREHFEKIWARNVLGICEEFNINQLLEIIK